MSPDNVQKLVWLFGESQPMEVDRLAGNFIGPRANMITPWSTNAVEIAQNMGIQGILRMEEFTPSTESATFDPMVSQKFNGLDQKIFNIEVEPQPIENIEDIAAYNQQ